MAYVLCYELIFGEGLKPHGPAERACLAAEAELQAAAEARVQAAGVESVADLVEIAEPQAHPRTARVNLLKCSVEEALAYLQDSDTSGFQAAVKARSSKLSF